MTSEVVWACLIDCANTCDVRVSAASVLVHSLRQHPEEQ